LIRLVIFHFQFGSFTSWRLR